jgi:hypothetical protein
MKARSVCSSGEMCLVEFLPFFFSSPRHQQQGTHSTQLGRESDRPAVDVHIENARSVRLFCGHIKTSRKSNTAIWLNESGEQKKEAQEPGNEEGADSL